MPIHHEIDEARRTVIARASGTVGLEELRDYLASLWTDPKHRDFHELFDWSGAEAVNLSVAELRSLAGAAHAFYHEDADTKLALVVPDAEGARRGELYRTLRSMRQGDGPGPRIRVFQDAAEARAWLGLPPA